MVKQFKQQQSSEQQIKLYLMLSLIFQNFVRYKPLILNYIKSEESQLDCLHALEVSHMLYLENFHISLLYLQRKDFLSKLYNFVCLQDPYWINLISILLFCISSASVFYLLYTLHIYPRVLYLYCTIYTLCIVNVLWGRGLDN